MTISGIGIDIVNTERFKNFNTQVDTFLEKIFTDKELEYCFNQSLPSNSLAGKFAAKEAIIKIFNKTFISDLKDLEILNDKYGKPFVNKAPIGIDTTNIKISISHDGNFAVAVASYN